MRIVILALGSRGDVQPYLALSVALKRAGHHPILATHAEFAPLIALYDIEHRVIEGNPQELLQSPEGMAWLASNKNPIRFYRGLMDLARPLISMMFESVANAIHDAEAVIFHPIAVNAFLAARKRGVPAWMAGLQPWTPTREFPMALLPLGIPLPASANYWSQILIEHLLWWPIRHQANAWSLEHLARARMPQPFTAMRKDKVPVLYAFSEVLMRRPRDWADHVHVTGYWFLDQPKAYTPPPELVRFLEAGPKPIYIGFGSMVDRTPDETSHLVVDALEKTGQRCILSQGWSGLANTRNSDRVLSIGSVPHDWLFPKMSAVVHHGGAGTTAAAMRAGVPAVVVPFFADQHFWASRVERAGLGPKPVPKHKLNADRLARALSEVVTNQKMRIRAQTAGEVIRGEDGLARALQITGLGERPLVESRIVRRHPPSASMMESSLF